MQTHTYAIFVRLNFPDFAPSPRIADLLIALDRCIHEISLSLDPQRIHKGVEGRVILFPNVVKEALDFARLLLERADSAGLNVQIGISHGWIQEIEDAGGYNVAGDSVNRAARLSAIENPKTRIAVDRSVHEDAQSGTDEYSGPHKFFGECIRKVKRTTLHCYWLQHKPVTEPDIDIPTSSLQSELAHIVVFDIERFSELEHADMGSQAFELNRAVQNAMARRGRSLLGSDKFFHASAGDGGALAFSSLDSGGYDAWGFAKDLLDRAAGRTLIRIGIVKGQVVINEDKTPVGVGVFEADKLSGRPEAGGICVSRRFWEEALDDADRGEWRGTPCEDDPDALILSSPNAVGNINGKQENRENEASASQDGQEEHSDDELVQRKGLRNKSGKSSLGKYAAYFSIVAFGYLLYTSINLFDLNTVTKAHSTDLYYKIKAIEYPRRHQDRISVVLLNEVSLRNLGSRWPATYDFHAAILDRIGRFRPRAIMIDLLFLDDRSDTDDSLPELADVLKNLEKGLDNLPQTRVFLATLTAEKRASEVLEPLKNRTYAATVFWRTRSEASKSPLYYPVAFDAGRTGNDAAAAYRIYRFLCATGEESCAEGDAGKPHFREPMQVYWGVKPTEAPFNKFSS